MATTLTPPTRPRPRAPQSDRPRPAHPVPPATHVARRDRGNVVGIARPLTQPTPCPMDGKPRAARDCANRRLGPSGCRHYGEPFTGRLYTRRFRPVALGASLVRRCSSLPPCRLSPRLIRQGSLLFDSFVGGKVWRPSSTRTPGRPPHHLPPRGGSSPHPTSPPHHSTADPTTTAGHATTKARQLAPRPRHTRNVNGQARAVGGCHDTATDDAPEEVSWRWR
jgi:hypothetical protein